METKNRKQQLKGPPVAAVPGPKQKMDGWQEKFNKQLMVSAKFVQEVFWEKDVFQFVLLQFQ